MERLSVNHDHLSYLYLHRIYQAYKYGVSKDTINDHGLLIISPYALVDNFNNDYRLKLVKKY